MVDCYSEQANGESPHPTVQDLGIDRLSVDDRIELVHAIWDTIPTGSLTPLLTEVQRRELERRLADHVADPDDVVPWEQILAEALARWKR